MRTLPAGVMDLLASGEYAVHARARIEDPDGNVIEVEYGADDRDAWLVSAEWGEDLDQPVSEATIRLRRSAEGALSLAPLMEGSPINRDGSGQYAPRLDLARRIVLEVQITAPWEQPSAAGWLHVFDGYVDRIDWSGPEAVLYCRDLGALLVDSWVEEESEYGSPDTGVPLEDVAQAILDDWCPGVTVYAPDPPGFMVTSYRIDRQSVMDALETLVQKIGWAIRYWWDPGAGQWRLTIYDPGRDKTTPDATFGPDDYADVTTLEIDRDLVRNVVEIEYRDAVTNERATVVAQDPQSIARYGRRWMRIEEADDSPIDTAAEAQAMADAALSDLAWPDAEQAIEMLLWPAAEIGDLYRFRANGVHYDRDHDWAVTSVRHQIALDRHRTTIRTRGKPAGMYRQWFRAGVPPPTGPDVPVKALPPTALIEYVSESANNVRLRYTGQLGTGATGSLQYRRRLVFGSVPGTWGPGVSDGWVPLPGGGIFEDVAIPPKVATVVELEVRDEAGRVGRDTYDIAPRLPVIGGDGRLDPDEPPYDDPLAPPLRNVVDGGVRAYTTIEPGGGVLTQGVTINDGVSPKVPVTGARQYFLTAAEAEPTGNPGDPGYVPAITFDPPYQDVPLVLVQGPMASHSGLSGTVYRREYAEGVTAAGIHRVVAQLVSLSGVSTETDPFPSGTISGEGSFQEVTLSSVADDDRYLVSYDIFLQATASSSGFNRASLSVTVAIDTLGTAAGSSWVERATRIYSVRADNNDTSQTIDTSETVEVVQRPISMIRVRLKNVSEIIIGDASTSHEVDPEQVEYQTFGEVVEPMAQDGQRIRVIVMGAT